VTPIVAAPDGLKHPPKRTDGSAGFGSCPRIVKMTFPPTLLEGC